MVFITSTKLVPPPPHPLLIIFNIFLFKFKLFGICHYTDAFKINSTFDLVNRDVWGANETIPRGNRLQSTLVRHVIVFQTKGNSCNSFVNCVHFLRNMQVKNIPVSKLFPI